MQKAALLQAPEDIPGQRIFGLFVAETMALIFVRIPDDPGSEQICSHDIVSPNVSERIGGPSRGIVTADTVYGADFAAVIPSGWPKQFLAAADVAADAPRWTGDDIRLWVEIERSKW